MSYVDGYVIAVPTKEKEAYIKLAKESADIFKDHGAISVVENWGESVPDGKLTSFPMAVKATDEETVVFSWVTWANKESRDAGIKSAMEDSRMSAMEPHRMPFDSKRLIFGGFETIVSR